jgi:hypothetical protein
MPKATHQRSWFWDCYYDHPSFHSGQGGTEGFFGAASGGKHKLYCKKCFDSHVAAVVQEDKDAVKLGQCMVAHDNPQIETYCMYCVLMWCTWSLKAYMNDGVDIEIGS